MTKKFYILTLLGFFFLSTTGLPLTINICSMKNMQSAGQCKMHMDNMDNMNNIKCLDDYSAGRVNMTAGIPACCQIKIVDNRVTDNFISTSNDTGTKIPVKVILITGLLNLLPELSFVKNIYSTGSPPLLSDNHIYLTNSILLI